MSHGSNSSTKTSLIESLHSISAEDTTASSAAVEHQLMLDPLRIALLLVTNRAGGLSSRLLQVKITVTGPGHFLATLGERDFCCLKLDESPVVSWVDDSLAATWSLRD